MKKIHMHRMKPHRSTFLTPNDTDISGHILNTVSWDPSYIFTPNHLGFTLRPARQTLMDKTIEINRTSLGTGAFGVVYPVLLRNLVKLDDFPFFDTPVDQNGIGRYAMKFPVAFKPMIDGGSDIQTIRLQPKSSKIKNDMIKEFFFGTIMQEPMSFLLARLGIPKKHKFIHVDNKKNPQNYWKMLVEAVEGSKQPPIWCAATIIKLAEKLQNMPGPRSCEEWDTLKAEVETFQDIAGYENIHKTLFFDDTIPAILTAKASCTLDELAKKPNMKYKLTMEEEGMPPMAKNIANQVGKGLLFMIQHVGFVTTDIKPANILYDEYTEIFTLADFGICDCAHENLQSEPLRGTRGYLPSTQNRMMGYPSVTACYSFVCTMLKILYFPESRAVRHIVDGKKLIENDKIILIRKYGDDIYSYMEIWKMIDFDITNKEKSWQDFESLMTPANDNKPETIQYLADFVENFEWE